MTTRFVPNPHYRADASFGIAQRQCFDPDEAAVARDQIRAWPVYEPTPLVDCDRLAAHLGLGRVWIKDEGLRAPLKSFKSLGGAYALGEHLRSHIEASLGHRPDYTALFDGAYRGQVSSFCVASATDGNHGRSLAWGAQLFGTQCRIYLPANVSTAREKAISDFGAKTVRVTGNYDAAVARARADAQQHGWAFIQDTSFEGYTEEHRLIMHGYSLMAEEIAFQLGPSQPTHAFLQVGCGGMAASVLGFLWSSWGGTLPRSVLVQSERADAVVRSFECGRHVVVDGAHDTLMIGIACGEIAQLVWPLVEPTTFGAMAIDDASAVVAMRTLADPRFCMPPMVMGETGAAGLAALNIACRDASLRERLGLNADSRVLLINSEGETDPASYAELVGQAAASVRRAAVVGVAS